MKYLSLVFCCVILIAFIAAFSQAQYELQDYEAVYDSDDAAFVDVDQEVLDQDDDVVEDNNMDIDETEEIIDEVEEVSTEESENVEGEIENENQEMEASESEELAFVDLSNVPAPVATNSTIAGANAVNPSAVFVPTHNITFPSVRNPHDKCGCYNNSPCQAGVCMCSPEWSGQWCERPSDLAISRRQELTRLSNLTNIISHVSRKIQKIEAVAGNPEVIQNLIAESARREVSKLHLAQAEREFYSALSRNDIYTAKSQLNLIKHLNYERYIPLKREFVVQEERINNQFNQIKPVPKVMQVPILHEDKYKDIEVGGANNVQLKTFIKAEDLNQKAQELRRQFNLDFGDPV